MNVSLTPELDRFIATKLEEGTYASQSEVVRAGLRLLMERDRLLEARFEAGPGVVEPSPVEPGAGDAAGAQRSTTLPSALWKHFPDLEPERLRYPADHGTIVPRLLRAPQLEAVRWLRENVAPGDLAAFLRSGRGRGLDPKSLRFWGLLLEVPREEVDAWVARASKDPWATRTHR